MTTPNLFTHARSELAQDAILAYLIEWAHPEHAAANPVLHRLGDSLLRKLVGCAAAATGQRDPLLGKQVTQLKVTTQGNLIDIAVEINGHAFLLIEDKVHTREHGDQIRRYVEKTRERRGAPEAGWVILPVFVKTGNVSPSGRNLSTKCGVFLREALLDILDAHADTGDDIVEQFRAYQREFESNTQSYLTLPPRDWTWTAMAGFYVRLCDWLVKAHDSGEIPVAPYPDWGWVSNPTGGFVGCWWGWSRLRESATKLYFQINEVDELHVRATNDDEGVGRESKIGKDQLYEVLHVLENAVEHSGIQGLRIVKAGQFRGGASGACAKFVFDDDPDDAVWIATDAKGLLDWPATQLRLNSAMALLHAACQPALRSEVGSAERTREL